MCLQLDVDTCIENTTWSTKTISNYHVEEKTRGFLIFLMLWQLILKHKKHIIIGFVLNDRHCTSYDCCYFKFSYLTGMLKNEPVQTFQGYLSEMTDCNIFLAGFPWISPFWNSFLYSVFLFLLFVYILKICRLMDNKYRQERKLKIVS